MARPGSSPRSASAHGTPRWGRGPNGERGKGGSPRARSRLPAQSTLRPLFGLGPQTIYKGGWGVEVEGEWVRTKSGEEEEQALHADLHYGLTEDLTLRLAVPLVKRKSETTLVPGVAQVEQDITGVGDAVLAAKYRFFQDLFVNGNHQGSLFGGLKLPVARTSTEPPLGSGSVDFLLGAR